MRLRRILLPVLCCLLLPYSAWAQETIGSGRLFTNDFLGDGHDRWQSGSYAHSTVRGPEDWTGAPQDFGVLREYRLRGAIMSSGGPGPAPGDRPYAGTLSFGVHSHFGAGTTRASLGVDLTAIGPQTGVSQFQQRTHDVLGLRQVPFTDDQIGNRFAFGVVAETAEVVAVSPSFTARPFAEVQIGPEDTLRVGADLFLGGTVASDILIRDVTTGQLYRGAEGGDGRGFSFVVGADMATVTDSIYLPRDNGVIALDGRGRLRAGVHWQGEDDTSLFYGLTYLSPEFDDQDAGQITGSLKLNFNF